MSLPWMPFGFQPHNSALDKTTSATFAFIVGVAAGSTGGGPVTTGAIDTTGATFLVGVDAYFSTTGGAFTDSKSNTWNPLTERTDGSVTATRIYYSVPTSVGSGHTFTSNSGFPSLFVAAFSGGAASPFDVENGATGISTSPAPGSITPTQNNELVIVGIALSNGLLSSIDSGFTITNTLANVPGNSFGGALAYLIQTSAGAVSPIGTASISNNWAAAIGSFKVS